MQHEIMRKIIRSKGFWIVLNIVLVFVYMYWIYMLLPPGSTWVEIFLRGLGFFGGLFVVSVLGYLLYSLRHNVGHPGLQEWWYDIGELSAFLTRILPFVLLGLPLFIMGRQVLADQNWSGELILVILSVLFAYFGGDFYRQERRRLEEWTREALSIWPQGFSKLLRYLNNIKDDRVTKRVFQYIPISKCHGIIVENILRGVSLSQHLPYQYCSTRELLSASLDLWGEIIDPLYRNRLLRFLLKQKHYEGSRLLEVIFRGLIYQLVYKDDAPVLESLLPLDPAIYQVASSAWGNQQGLPLSLFPLNPHAEFAYTFHDQIINPVLGPFASQIVAKHTQPFLYCIGEEGVGRTTLALHFASFSFRDFELSVRLGDEKSIITFPRRFPIYLALYPEEDLVYSLMRQITRTSLAVMWFFFPIWKQDWFALREWTYVALLLRFFVEDMKDMYEYLRGLPFYETEEIRTFLNIVQKHAPLLSLQDLLRIWPVVRISTERFLARLPYLWLLGGKMDSNGGRRTPYMRFHLFIDFQWAPREEELRTFFADLHRLHFDPATLFLPYTEPPEGIQQWVKLQWNGTMLRKLLKQLKIDLYAWIDVETEADLEELLIEAAQNNPQRMLHLLARTQMEANLRGGEISEEVFYNIIYEGRSS